VIDLSYYNAVTKIFKNPDGSGNYQTTIESGSSFTQYLWNEGQWSFASMGRGWGVLSPEEGCQQGMLMRRRRSVWTIFRIDYIHECRRPHWPLWRPIFGPSRSWMAVLRNSESIYFKCSRMLSSRFRFNPIFAYCNCDILFL
jgi:hypothetical protein